MIIFTQPAGTGITLPATATLEANTIGILNKCLTARQTEDKVYTCREASFQEENERRKT